MSARRHRLLLCAFLSVACLPTALAAAAGPPLPSSASGAAGAVAPGGSVRFLTRRAGTDTVVVVVRQTDGRILRTRRIGGRWSVPSVTLDNGTTGLSTDGRMLVLARPTQRFPTAATHLAVIDARQLVMRRQIRLPGFFTVDAISPDGRWAYLIQYADSVLDYRVRALDTHTGRLAARDVVDPRSPGEQMGGLPMTRTMSADGRWAYTLYGGGKETFIHALDTVGRRAACIDLDMLPPDRDVSAVRLRVSPGDGRLRRHLAVRTAFFDRETLDAVRGGVQQVVIVGAGYDGRALRFASPDVRWFEIDHPATQEDKRARLTAIGAPSGQTAFVAVDLVDDDLVAALRAAGHDPARPSLFVVEGLLGYLPRPVTSALLASLHELAGHGSRLAVAFPTALPEAAPARERLRRRLRGLLVAALGEPWLTRFNPDEPEQLLTRAGWAVAVNDGKAVRYQGRNGLLVAAEPVAAGGA